MAKRSGKIRVGLLCGGPSLERGISLNSARSVCDHLHSEEIEVEPIYFDLNKKPYKISRDQLYSNTPSDFDFKLAHTATALKKTELVKHLKSLDIVFPAMHGPFGEDGEIQRFLEKHKIPFIGAPGEACEILFDKHTANQHISSLNFFTLPSIAVSLSENSLRRKIKKFFNDHNLSRVIVKPATGGSSIAVYQATSVDEALEKVELIVSERVDDRVVIEPFCTGTEFTVIILQNRFNLPVAILPTEIELDNSDFQIFDYRKKYLATRQVTYHCPPRFSDEIINRIQSHAEQLFTLFGMRDFARFDGWVMPDGKIWFSDFNPISGMEQNSFLFMQTARLGMSHRDVLRYILKSACRRYEIPLPEENKTNSRKKENVRVLFGGDTAERQVSLMSGTNAWLKLKRSNKYNPIPYLLDNKEQIWKLPYGYGLNHTVEEVLFMCRGAENTEGFLKKHITRTLDRLGLEDEDYSEELFTPKPISIEEFLEGKEFVFLGLHGGIGEDGTIQRILEERESPFNGPGELSSRTCMNKYVTGEVVSELTKEDPGIRTARKKLAKVKGFKGYTPVKYHKSWDALTKALKSPTVVVKPLGDGCSAGIARLCNPEDLEHYCRAALRGSPFIPDGTLSAQHGIIEMPTDGEFSSLIFEEFIETDELTTVDNDLRWEKTTGLLEVTVGVLEERGKLKVLNPSITVANGDILSLEEKFQGGTGVNITPPPAGIVSELALRKIKKRIQIVAEALGIEGYSRIDAFVDTESGDIIVIEANTLPALTPSTVIFHQALAEKTPIHPVQLLEKIVATGQKRYTQKRRAPKIPNILHI